MHTILIVGAGRIGTLMACLLASQHDYQVYLADIKFNQAEVNRLRQKFNNLQFITADAAKQQDITELVRQHNIQTIASCLPYYCNMSLAQIAKDLQLNYFDLTEDVFVSDKIRQLAQGANTAFMPHCGVAPGLVNIIAHTLMLRFDELNAAKLRVGALPQFIDNALHYALTWSTEGLINEYGNSGYAIDDRKNITVMPLENLEHLILDGVAYEAFNTSGGLGTLIKTYVGKINHLNYKTIRYPGHCEKMRFLMQDLKLNQQRETLKNILEDALPRTYQDMVIIYVAVNGNRDNQFIEETFFKKILPQNIAGLQWTAIQIATAASACAAIDLTLNNSHYQGFILQEQFTLHDIFENRFGKHILI